MLDLVCFYIDMTTVHEKLSNELNDAFDLYPSCTFCKLYNTRHTFTQRN